MSTDGAPVALGEPVDVEEQEMAHTGRLRFTRVENGSHGTRVVDYSYWPIDPVASFTIYWPKVEPEEGLA